MAQELRFSDEKKFEGWLRGKPDDWARVIAWRAAMRVVPLTAGLAGAEMADDAKQRLWLSLYRRLLISPAAHDWPAENMTMAALSTAGSAWSTLSAAASAWSALSAAGSAWSDLSGPRSALSALSALSAALSALSAARSTLSARSALSALRAAVSSDARALDRGVTVGALAATPLWPDAAPPKWYSTAWRDLSSAREVLNVGFRPWLDWYAALAGLDGSAQPHDIFGPALSRKIALQPDEWWDRDVRAVNDDVAAWLKNETDLIADIAAVAGDIPRQAAGAYRFGWSDGVLKPLPPDPASDAEDAAILLGEARRKAEEFLERLAWTNVDPRIKRSVELVLAAMPAQGAVNGVLLRTRTRSVEADAAAFAGSLEVAEDVQSRLIDLAGTLRDALTCYPKVREMEAESLALDLQLADVAGVVRHADGVLDAARDAPAEIIHPDSVTALAEMAQTAEEPGTLPQSPSALRQLADRLVVTRNFLAAMARGAATAALDKATAAGGKAKAHWDEVRPKIVDATIEEYKFARTSEGAASLMTLLFTAHTAMPDVPVAGLAVAWLAGYPVIKVYFDIALKRLKSDPPEAPPDDPPP